MRRRWEEPCCLIKDRVVHLPQKCSSSGHDSMKAAKQSEWCSSVAIPTLKRKGGLKSSLLRYPECTGAGNFMCLVKSLGDVQKMIPPEQMHRMDGLHVTSVSTSGCCLCTLPTKNSQVIKLTTKDSILKIMPV